MIVLDASVVVELLLNGPAANSISTALSEQRRLFLAPHLLDVEVASALRSMVAGKRLDSHRSEQLLVGLATLPVKRFPHVPMLGRMWELRHNFTAYDAAYIALAETTKSVLFTCDSKLATGHRAEVLLLTQP